MMRARLCIRENEVYGDFFKKAEYEDCQLIHSRKTGKSERVKEGMDLVFYEKPM